MARPEVLCQTGVVDINAVADFLNLDILSQLKTAASDESDDALVMLAFLRKQEFFKKWEHLSQFLPRF